MEAQRAPGTVAAQTFANVTNPLLERHLSVGPTIAVPAGTRINVHVARDLAIDPRRVL
jgi:type IV secretory pathway VirB10-like protein